MQKVDETLQQSEAKPASAPRLDAVETMAVDARPWKDGGIEVTWSPALNAHRVRVRVFDTTGSRDPRKYSDKASKGAIRIGKLAHLPQPLTIVVRISGIDGIGILAEGEASIDLR